MNKRPALGKGLASLLSASSPADMSAQSRSAGVPALTESPSIGVDNKDRHPGISLAFVEEIALNPFQPRKDFDDQSIKELKDSILENGLIQPLIVRKGPSGFELIAGERRLRAAKAAGLKQVPVVIRRTTDKEALEVAIVENVQREDLNCIEEALAYQRLSEEFSLSQDDVAKKVGKDRSTVTNAIRLLKLPSLIQQDLRVGKISSGHAKVILGLESAEDQIKLRNMILENRLSVRDTEERARIIKLSKFSGASVDGEIKTNVDPLGILSRLKSLSKEMTKKFGSKTLFQGNGQKGKVVIRYDSREDLDRIIEKFQNLS